MRLIARTICALLMASTFAGQAFVQNHQSAKTQLLETGDGFHGDEVKARSGEKWLGLYVTKRGSFLAESTLKVERVFDPVIDEDERKPTGKSVGVDRRAEPVLLVKNAKMLKPGAVTTVYHGGYDEAHSFGRKPRVTLKLGGQTYRLNIVSPKRLAPEAAGLLPPDAKLSLTSGPSTQILYSLNGSSDDLGWYLLWAGDLDGDGKLDLYLSLSYHYNVTQRRLFLSSQARAGRLAHQVAEFVTTGC
jgi:hypothetical protein